jgi:hypothetical protein
MSDARWGRNLVAVGFVGSGLWVGCHGAGNTPNESGCDAFGRAVEQLGLARCTAGSSAAAAFVTAPRSRARACAVSTSSDRDMRVLVAASPSHRFDSRRSASATADGDGWMDGESAVWAGWRIVTATSASHRLGCTDIWSRARVVVELEKAATRSHRLLPRCPLGRLQRRRHGPIPRPAHGRPTIGSTRQTPLSYLRHGADYVVIASCPRATAPTTTASKRPPSPTGRPSQLRLRPPSNAGTPTRASRCRTEPARDCKRTMCSAVRRPASS